MRSAFVKPLICPLDPSTVGEYAVDGENGLTGEVLLMDCPKEVKAITTKNARRLGHHCRHELPPANDHA